MALLAEHGAGIDEPNRRGATPLFLASYYGFEEGAALLLGKGARTGTVAWQGAAPVSPKQAAAIKGDDENLMAMERWDEPPPESPRLHRTAGSFMRRGSHVRGVAALHVAVQRGHVGVAKLLRRYGASVSHGDYDGRNPLHYAARLLDADAIDALRAEPDLLITRDDEFVDPREAGAKAAAKMHTVSGRTPLEVGLEAALKAISDAKSGDAATSSEAIANMAETVISKLLDAGADANETLSDLSGVPGQRPLHLAVRGSMVAIARRLVEGGADVNTLDPHGVPPLVQAARLGPGLALDMATALAPAVDAGELAVDATDGQGIAAMQVAVATWPRDAERAIADFAAFVVARGGAVDLGFASPCEHAPAALTVATQRAMCSTLIPTLIRLGADVDRRDDSGATAALYAARHGSGTGAALYATPSSPAECEHEALALLEALGEPDVTIAAGDGSSCIETCIGTWVGGEEGAKFVRKVLDLGADKNFGTMFPAEPPLCCCARLQKLEEAIVLLEAGASTEVTHAGSGRTPAHAAARNQHVSLLRALRDAGADLDAAAHHGETPLIVAAAATAAAMDAVELLLSAGCVDVGAADLDGVTPLFAAAGNGHAPLMTVLLEAGAHPAPTHTASGRNALHVAVESGNPGAVAVLHDFALGEGHAAIDGWLDAEDAAGLTALSLAAALRFAPLVALLLEAGASPNARDTQGEFLMLAAAKEDDSVIASVLLTRARRPLERLDSALVEFALHGNEGMVESLLLAGADVNGDERGHLLVLLLIALDRRSGSVSFARKVLHVAGVLVRFGADIDEDVLAARYTADTGRSLSWLGVAAAADEPGAVNMLVAAGFWEADSSGMRGALCHAVELGHAKAAAALLAYPGVEDALQSDALVAMAAADVSRAGDQAARRMAVLLLAHGADGDQRHDGQSVSAVGAAINRSDAALLSMLVCGGCNVMDNTTLLNVAVQKSDVYSVSTLLGAGCAIQPADMFEAFRLLQASSTAGSARPCSQTSVAMMLLQAGGPADVQVSSGESLLSAVYENGSINFRDPAALKMFERFDAAPIQGFRDENFINAPLYGVGGEDVLGDIEAFEMAFNGTAAAVADEINDDFAKYAREKIKDEIEDEIKGYAKEEVTDSLRAGGREVSDRMSAFWQARTNASVEGNVSKLDSPLAVDCSVIEQHLESAWATSPLGDSAVAAMGSGVMQIQRDLQSAAIGPAMSSVLQAAGGLMSIFASLVREATMGVLKLVAKVALAMGAAIFAPLVLGPLAAVLGPLGAPFMVAFEAAMPLFEMAAAAKDFYDTYQIFITFGKTSLKFGTMVRNHQRWPRDVMALRLLISAGADIRAVEGAVPALAAPSTRSDDPRQDGAFEGAWAFMGMVGDYAIQFPHGIDGYSAAGDAIVEKFARGIAMLQRDFEDRLCEGRADPEFNERKARKEFQKMVRQLEEKRTVEISTELFKLRMGALYSAFAAHTSAMRSAERWWQQAREAAGRSALQRRQAYRLERAEACAEARMERLEAAIAWFREEVQPTYAALVPLEGELVAPQGSDPADRDEFPDRGASTAAAQVCVPVLGDWPKPALATKPLSVLNSKSLNRVMVVVPTNVAPGTVLQVTDPTTRAVVNVTIPVGAPAGTQIFVDVPTPVVSPRVSA